jgi:Putative zinc-finger
MDCKQAEQLFDAYLDGELSGTLSTELGAHRLQCANCRRALALLEVTGHIVSADREPESLSPDFTERLLACVDEQENSVWVRWQHRFYVGAPLAAAAVIVLAFAGVFDGTREGKVAGKKEINSALRSDAPVPVVEDDEAVEPADEAALSDWFRRTEENVKSKKQSGESLQRALDSTLEQVLDVLENEAGSTPADIDADAGNTPDSPPPGDDASDDDGR